MLANMMFKVEYLGNKEEKCVRKKLLGNHITKKNTARKDVQWQILINIKDKNKIVVGLS